MVKCSRCGKMKPEVTKLNRICQSCRTGKPDTQSQQQKGKNEKK